MDNLLVFIIYFAPFIAILLAVEGLIWWYNKRKQPNDYTYCPNCGGYYWSSCSNCGKERGK